MNLPEELLPMAVIFNKRAEQIFEFKDPYVRVARDNLGAMRATVLNGWQAIDVSWNEGGEHHKEALFGIPIESFRKLEFDDKVSADKFPIDGLDETLTICAAPEFSEMSFNDVALSDLIMAIGGISQSGGVTMSFRGSIVRLRSVGDSFTVTAAQVALDSKRWPSKKGD